MTRSNGTLKVPGQTRDRKRQKNNGNSGIKVRLIIDLDPMHYCGRSCESYFKSTITITVNL